MGKEPGAQDAVRQRLRGRFDRLRQLSTAGVEPEPDWAPPGPGRRDRREAAGVAVAGGAASRPATFRHDSR
jgi:hypothetical protein